MAASKNSKRSRPSNSTAAAVAICFAACAAVMAIAVAVVYRMGATLYSGDAEAHLNIARRVIDSRTPGWAQLGTAWLPLPHLLMIPLVRNDWMWQTGLAGGITSGLCMAVAATFLFASLLQIFRNRLAAAAGCAVFLLNPNSLYLGAIPMTEPVLFASVFALLYFTIRFAETRAWGALIGAGFAACAGTLTRYEAWFLLPFAAAYIWWKGGERRWLCAAVFSAIAGAGPLLWFWHNWWYFEDPLYFYRGPWSAIAIQGRATYPGRGDWRMASLYYFTAAKLIASLPALAVGAVGLCIALFRRAFWPVIFLCLPPAFYVWSIHSSSTPIHVPELWPHAWYNIRYAIAVLPVVALGAAALASTHRFVAVAVVLLTLASFCILSSQPPITLQEAENNSRGRRDWTAQASSFCKTAVGRHETFFTSFGDMTAIYRTCGIPLRDTLTGDINPQFTMATSRPDMLLWEDWAIVMGGDTVQTVIDKARLHGPRFELSRRIIVKGQPVIEIYHRTDDIPLR